MHGNNNFANIPFPPYPAIAIDKNRFVIGKIDLEAGRTYGWLSILANKTGKDFKIYVDQNGTTQVMTVPL